MQDELIVCEGAAVGVRGGVLRGVERREGLHGLALREAPARRVRVAETRYITCGQLYLSIWSGVARDFLKSILKCRYKIDFRIFYFNYFLTRLKYKLYFIY